MPHRWLLFETAAATGPVSVNTGPIKFIQPNTVLGRAVWGTDTGNTDIGGASSVMCAYICVAPISGSFNHLTAWFITNPSANGYSAGTGGTIQCRIETVDGSNNPTGTLVNTGATATHGPLALVDGHWVGSPMTQIQAQFPDLTLSSPAVLTAGQKFAIVFQNVHASPAANYVGLDALYQYAGSGGNMGFNSPDLDSVWDHKQKIGAGAWVSRRSPFETATDFYTLPIFVLTDTAAGNSISQTFMADLDGRIFGGTQVCRQLFTPPTTVSVDRARIMIARNVVGCTSFRLGITLGTATTEAYIQSGNAFADTDISSLAVQLLSAPDVEPAEFAGKLVNVTFSAPITLTGGTQYALLVSTPTASGIHVHGAGLGSSWWGGKHSDPFFGGVAQFGTVGSFATWTNTDARLPIYLLQVGYVAGGVPVNTVAPVVSGTTTVGSTLSCTTGTWTNSPSSYAYQWKRGATNVGTNAATYILVSGDNGANMTCVVTATNGSGAGLPATSNSVGPVTTVTLPLDTLTTNLAGAWSTRKLLSAFAGSCWNIRRTSDNALAAIGFDGSNDGDAAAVAAHGTDCYLHTWYDQSVNARNFVQTTAGNQLRVRFGGGTHTQNGKLCIIVPDIVAFMVATAAYGSNTLSGYFVGSTAATDYRRLLGVKSDGESDDANGPFSALCIVKHGSSAILGGYRNGTPLADAGSVSMTDSVVFAAGFRWDATNYNARRSTLTAAEASSGNFDVDKILLHTNDGAAGYGPVTCQTCEIALWFGDIGDTAMQTVLSNARTYWSAV